MGVVVFNSTSNMRIFITLASLLALAECRRHLCDDGTRPICPDGTKAVYNRPTGKIPRDPHISHPLYVREKESPHVPMDQWQDTGSTPVAMKRRSVLLGKGLGQETSHVQPVLTGPSVPVQEEGRTARSVSKGAPIGRAVLHSVRREFHTAPGLPRTGTNMTGSGTSTQEITGLETKLEDTTGDQNIQAIYPNFFYDS